MPALEKHVALASEYLNAVRNLSQPQFCRPMAVCAYYGSMHLIEALLAKPILDNRPMHLTSHHDRIAIVLRRKDVFGEKESKALYALYDFSYMARYIYQDKTDYSSGAPQPKRGSEIDLDVYLKQSSENVQQIVTRVNRLIR